MADPFEKNELPNSMGARVFGARKRSAGQSIENTLAEAAKITNVSESDVRTACRSCSVDSRRQVLKECKSLYGRYLDYCFEDQKLTAEENEDLAHLQQVLGLSDADVRGVQDDVAISVYGRAVAEVLDDLRIEPDEAEFLQGLREALALDEGQAERILQEGALDARYRARQRATSADRAFIARRTPVDEFVGRSETSLESAVGDALEKAALAIPKLHWFEISQLSGYVADGSPSQWYVVVKAGIESDG